jgi:hypothetical protein
MAQMRIQQESNISTGIQICINIPSTMSEPYAATSTDAATAAAPTAASTLSETAFRQAEKRYQLHYDQQMRLR